MNIYSVKDLVSQTYIPPFTMKTNRDAKSGFKVVTNEEGTPYNQHPEDYILYKIAEYDERTGVITPVDAEQIAIAKELVEGGN